MRYLFGFMLLALACWVPSVVNAATCFWVGGTGTWSTSNTASWSSATGPGGGGSCAATGGIPKQAGDVATFDASSGGGTVTVGSTINGATLNTITMGAFTGTLDFSVNNPSITLGANGVGSLNASGTGVRTLKLGSGTFTLKSSSNNCLDFTTTTNLTYDTASTATFNIVTSGNGSAENILPGSQVFTNNTLNITSRTDGSWVRLQGSTTFKAVTFSGTTGATFELNTGITLTITNAIAWNGTSTGLIQLYSDNFFAGTSKANIAIASGSTLTWANINLISFTGTTATATNSFVDGVSTGVSVTGPSTGGGGGRIIGG